ncbi:hypothetical protein [Enterobacter hormaechei]|uniref:hypothetical protein n=1 Tax=Enterobacter hormaechei TaxID=158836 RepID=UPI002175776B|nr:hypothetical protein [Enterobacter hormaechei]UVZ93283.1 hypothetical protein M5T14_22320 [Enterobacter hormaechei]
MPVVYVGQDLYFRQGLDALVKTLSLPLHPPLAIMDDGVQYIYFIELSVSLSINEKPSESISFLLENLKGVMAKSSPFEHIRNEIVRFKKGRYRHVQFTSGQMRVMNQIARGIPPRIAMAKLDLNYKSWHNFKDAAYNRVGIRNTNSFIRAVNIYNELCDDILMWHLSPKHG